MTIRGSFVVDEDHMYAGNPSIETPPDASTIWRYMDFPKFVSMLDASSLWFTRLGFFEDHYEGAMPISSMMPVEEIMERSNVTEEEARAFSSSLHGTLNQITRRFYFANCWHMNEGESAAFWRIYGNEEIAIRSTVGRLKAAFPPIPWPTISIGEVKYTDDPERDETAKKGLEHVLLKKRGVYSYEKELRAFFHTMPPPKGFDQAPTADDFDQALNLVLTEGIPPGRSVPVDLDLLIERIYVASGQPGWFEALVRSLLAKYGLGKKDVERSGLNRRPEFWRDPVAMRDRFLDRQRGEGAT